VNTLLFELDELGTVEPDFELLDLSSNSYLEKNMEFLIDCLDELGTEQNKFQFYNRAVMRQQQQQAQWLQKRVTPLLKVKLNY
jgi:translation initiation factor 3 subunit H